jgi:hypothetical protein
MNTFGQGGATHFYSSRNSTINNTLSEFSMVLWDLYRLSDMLRKHQNLTIVVCILQRLIKIEEVGVYLSNLSYYILALLD